MESCIAEVFLQHLVVSCCWHVLLFSGSAFVYALLSRELSRSE